MISQELKNEYPFSPHYFTIGDHKLHYIDEGSGEAIVMLHGNPTWSFFYRNLAKHFQKTNRVIVPDHIGCGLSDKPGDYEYTLSNHIQNTTALIKKLDLKNVTLIVHDWGGAIGMGVVTENLHLFKKIVIMNTAAFRSIEIPMRINILRNPVGEWFIRTFNGFAGPATVMAVTKKLSPIVKAGFVYPYHDYESRIATAKFVRDIPMSATHPTYKTLSKIENNLSTVKLPVLILWGEKDFCFTMNFQKKWLEFFPNAKVKTYSDAGHYLTEDKKDDVIMEIENFIKGD